MKIKQLDAIDHEHLLIKMQKSCLPNDELYDVTKGFWWGAFDNDICVGFCGLVPSTRWGDCGYLCRSGVARAFRGKGIQKKLIKARERKARALGWNWLITDTTDNPASSNSLISCGFKLFNPTIPWGGKNTLYWRKHL
jgi:GNAT superfamily N-acetyltransferase